MLQVIENRHRVDDDEVTHDIMMERVRVLLPDIRSRARWTDEHCRLPAESVQAFYDIGLPRVLMPKSCGGMELGIRTWVDLAIEIGKADGSHAWCASLMMHHPHYLAMWPKEAQDFVWQNGPDQGIAVSIAPVSKVEPIEGGYNIVKAHARYVSGINHCPWIVVGGMVPGEAGAPEWRLFLIPPGKFRIEEVWDTVGMRGSGSNDAHIEDLFVPDGHTIRFADLVDGTGPGTQVHGGHDYRVPLITYSPLTFLGPMLGAALGAIENYRILTQTRINAFGAETSKDAINQIKFGKAEATIDLAQLLLDRCIAVTERGLPLSDELRARSYRDQIRISELIVEGMEQLMSVIGSSGFAKTNPVQQAWRDIRTAASHMALTPEGAYMPWGRLRFGLPRDPKQALY